VIPSSAPVSDTFVQYRSKISGPFSGACARALQETSKVVVLPSDELFRHALLFERNQIVDTQKSIHWRHVSVGENMIVFRASAHAFTLTRWSTPLRGNCSGEFSKIFQSNSEDTEAGGERT
jgi:hypothetical protein